MNVCVSQNSYNEILIDNVIVLGGGAFLGWLSYEAGWD